MLGALVGEAVAGGMPAGQGAAMPDTPPSAYAMGALAVAADGGWSMRGTLRVWAMHHDSCCGLPGLGSWAIQGDAHLPDAGDGDPSYRPWTALLPWIVAEPGDRAAALMSLLHCPGGVHHQAGLAAVRLVEARLAGAPPDAAKGILDRLPALVPGDVVADALRTGAALGWRDSFDGAMAGVRALAPAAGKPLAGFVAGAVAHAGLDGTLPGWCHLAALSMEEDVLAALGMFERMVASRPRRAPWVDTILPSPAANVPQGGLVARILAGFRSGVAAFAPGGHARVERP